MSIPKQHTVYRLHGFGKPAEVLKAHTEEVPKPNPDEILVKVKAVSLNYRDLIIASGEYGFGKHSEGVIPGSDLAGEVVAVGKTAEQEFKVGDDVISNFSGKNVYRWEGDLASGLGNIDDGVIRQYAILQKDAANKIVRPKGFTWAQAASLTCTGVTAWNALYGLKRLTAGDYVLLIGTGGVSLTGLAIAKAAGAIVIITSSSDEKLKSAKEHGADFGINYTKVKDWDQEVRKITNGNGVDFVLETGGIGTIEKSLSSVALGGVISCIGFVAPAPKELPDLFLRVLASGAILRGIHVGGKPLAQQLIKFVENKGLDIRVDKTFDFNEGNGVVDAYEHLASAQQVGKVAITF